MISNEKRWWPAAIIPTKLEVHELFIDVFFCVTSRFCCLQILSSTSATFAAQYSLWINDLRENICYNMGTFVIKRYNQWKGNMYQNWMKNLKPNLYSVSIWLNFKNLTWEDFTNYLRMLLVFVTVVSCLFPEKRNLFLHIYFT